MKRISLIIILGFIPLVGLFAQNRNMIRFAGITFEEFTSAPQMTGYFYDLNDIVVTDNEESPVYTEASKPDCSTLGQNIPGLGSPCLTNQDLEKANSKDVFLRIRVYYPRRRSNSGELYKLPLIIYNFGGAFAWDNYNSKLTDVTCKALAAKGFVVAAMQYRVGIDVLSPELAMRAIVRGFQDTRAAVKYWRNANKDTRWAINKEKIYIMGHSAGGINAINNLYLSDNYEEEKRNGILRPAGQYKCTSCGVTVPDLGGIDELVVESDFANTGNKNGVANAGVAWAGAIAKPEWVGKGEPPLLMIQHKDDGVVPYQKGKPFTGSYGGAGIVASTFLPTVNGSCEIKNRAENIGKEDIALITITGNNTAGRGGASNFSQPFHNPQYKFNNTVSFSDPKLESRVINATTGFFMKQAYPFIVDTNSGYPDNPCIANNAAGRIASEEVSSDVNHNISVYPNPSQGEVNVVLPANQLATLEVTNLQGMVLLLQQTENTRAQLDLNQYASGVYILKITLNKAEGQEVVVRRLVIE